MTDHIEDTSNFVGEKQKILRGLADDDNRRLGGPSD